METKPLLYGLIGFFIGGLLVAIAANTFDKAELQEKDSMSQMVSSLEQKQGEEYDKAFLSEMIGHHQAAVDMAKLSAGKAHHQEIKQLSNEIIKAQEQEISQMRQWQAQWGYADSMSH